MAETGRIDMSTVKGRMDLTQVSDEAIETFRKTWMNLLRERGFDMNELERLQKERDRGPIFDEVNAERKRQDDKWGGPDHDDEHEHEDWIAFIHKHADNGYADTVSFSDMKLFRRQMIRVAALAVAAVEWCDRKAG